MCRLAQTNNIMKTIIISDLESRKESILPYALNFAKYISNEVDIIHPIDSRVFHAVSSEYANSQRMGAGDSLSNEAIMKRDIHKAETAMDRMISSEVSRLNYPLRVNGIVRESTLEDLVTGSFGDEEYKLLITAAEPDGKIVDDLDEVIRISGLVNALALVVPKKQRFHEPKKAFTLNNIEHGGDTFNSGLSYLVMTFNLVIDQIVTTIVQNTHLKTYDLALISRESGYWKNLGIFSHNKFRELLTRLNLPVLVY